MPGRASPDSDRALRLAEDGQRSCREPSVQAEEGLLRRCRACVVLLKGSQASRTGMTPV